MKMMQRLAKHRNKKGFTLIEMLIVIIIIALILSIAMPAGNAVLNRAKKTTAQANARNIWIAQQGKMIDEMAGNPEAAEDWEQNIKLPEGQESHIENGTVYIYDKDGNEIARYPTEGNTK